MEYENDRNNDRNNNCPWPTRQTHVHEILGSTIIAERCTDPHNHRFATVSNEVIGSGLNHVHEVKFRTDFYENHFHEFCGRTGPARIIGDNRHVHYLEAETTRQDGHRHEFRFGTLIDNPIED